MTHMSAEMDSQDHLLIPSLEDKVNENENENELDRIIDVNGVVFNRVYRNCPQMIRCMIENPLLEIIQSFSFQAVNATFVSSLMKKYLDMRCVVPQEEGKLVFDIEVALKAAAIFYLSLQPEYVFDKFNTFEELLQEYPSFRVEALDIDELQYLLFYRNMMTVAITVIPARGNKKLLMKLCALLEGSGRIYPTGGTQSKATCRRVAIYEQESHCLPTKRNCFKAKKEKVPIFVVCSCGAQILKRTVWKHMRSLKHRKFDASQG